MIVWVLVVLYRVMCLYVINNVFRTNVSLVFAKANYASFSGEMFETTQKRCNQQTYAEVVKLFFFFFLIYSFLLLLGLGKYIKCLL